MNALREKANEARRRANEKQREHKELVARSLDPDLLASEQRNVEKKISSLYPEVAAAEREADRQEALAEAREKIPVSPRELAGGYGDSMNPWPATARGELDYGAWQYVPNGEASFIRDLVAVSLPGQFSPDAVAAANERLRRNELEARDTLNVRDVSTASPGSGAFVPPVYLGDQWIGTARPGRPLADAVAKLPYPVEGKTVSMPRVKVGPEAAVQAAEADAVHEVDLDSELYTVDKVTIAGQSDHSIQSLEWTQPGMDLVAIRELVRSYDSSLDFQLLYGTGTSGQHRGLKTVVTSDGGNAITFSTGGADELLGKVYEAVGDISTNAPGFTPTAVVLHPRRAAWIASHRDANSNLLQQGQLVFAAGTQAGGGATNIAGLQVIMDGNVLTNQGSGTNEDDVFVLTLEELFLAEGPLRTRVLVEPLSGTLQVRLQCFSFSAFLGGRRPKTIARISGSALSSPSYPST
jgi:hypothetical protein